MKFFLTLVLLFGFVTNINAFTVKDAKDTYGSIFANGTKISLSLNEDNEVLPDIYLPINWSKKLSSSIEYKIIQELEEGTVKNADQSTKDTTLDKKEISLELLKYNISSNYSFGIGYSSQSFDKNQKGYFITNNTRYDYDNNVNIDIAGITVFADVIYRVAPKFDLKLDLSILPASTLDVTQDTDITNLPTGKGSSSEELDLIYEIRTTFNYDLTAFLDLGFETRYKHLPMKYSLELAKSDNTFETQNYEVEEKIIYNSIKLYFKTKLFGDLRPMIGYSTEKTDGTNKLDDSTYSDTEDLFLFGFNTKF